MFCWDYSVNPADGSVNTASNNSQTFFFWQKDINQSLLINLQDIFVFSIVVHLRVLWWKLLAAFVRKKILIFLRGLVVANSLQKTTTRTFLSLDKLLWNQKLFSLLVAIMPASFSHFVNILNSGSVEMLLPPRHHCPSCFREKSSK